MAEKSTKKAPAPGGQDRGYIGCVPDETPNKDYTVEGVSGDTTKVTDVPTSIDTKSTKGTKS